MKLQLNLSQSNLTSNLQGKRKEQTKQTNNSSEILGAELNDCILPVGARAPTQSL